MILRLLQDEKVHVDKRTKNRRSSIRLAPLRLRLNGIRLGGKRPWILTGGDGMGLQFGDAVPKGQKSHYWNHFDEIRAFHWAAYAELLRRCRHRRARRTADVNDVDGRVGRLRESNAVELGGGINANGRTEKTSPLASADGMAKDSNLGGDVVLAVPRSGDDVGKFGEFGELVETEGDPSGDMPFREGSNFSRKTRGVKTTHGISTK